MKRIKSKKNLDKNKWLFRVSLFLFITLFVLIFIGFNSNYLINSYLHIVMIFFECLLAPVILLFCKRFKFSKIFITLFIIYFLGCTSFLTLLYGPYDNFRDWFITTAMGTNSHEYYAYWFYLDEQIDEVMSIHYIIEPDEDTDSTLVDTSLNVEVEPDIVYENEYEEAVLDREEGTAYKIIEFEVNGANAYLAIIYDPSDVAVGVTSYLGESGQYVTTMAKKYEAVLAINGGRFYDPGYSSTGGTPSGITFSNGELITGSSSTSTKVIGFNEDDVLVLINDCTVEQAYALGIRDAVYSTPFLIVNGTPSFISGNGGWGVAARTAIGQRADGIVLFLVVDSNEFRTAGADMYDLTEIMQNYGAINAANLDGGTSSVMAVNYELINDPIDSNLEHKTRPVATMFYLKS